ncbi:MAG: type IX secretion system PorP/SprF family membrane protein [Roseivirga sp.]|jgi:type IX secretion system PorP/SprF family membrane protein
MIGTFRYTLVLLITSTLSVFAQQDAQFTQYMYNQLYYNPAFAGSGEGSTLMAIHRSQWFGYDGSINQGGAPNTQLISYNTKLEKLKTGLGIYLSNDNLGPSNNFQVQTAISKNINLPNGGVLTFGLNLGLFSSSINFDDVIVVNPNDPISIGSGKESQIRPDFGAGIIYRKGNYFGGFSTNHLLQPKFGFGESQVSNQLNRHYYLTMGYDYSLNPQIKITPTVLLKSVSLNTYNIDVSVIGEYNNNLRAGLAYRQSESASLILGYKILSDRSLTLAYAFDFVVGNRQSKEPTSQELMLIYNFKSVPGIAGRRIIRTPRFRY